MNYSQKILMLLVLLIATAVNAESDIEEVSIINNISAIMGIGGNIAIVNSANGILIIDNGLAKYSAALVEHILDVYSTYPK